MFQAERLSDYEDTEWDSPSVGVNLLIYSLLKFILTALSISCPIPCGIFTPVFTCGATIGRLFGHNIDYFFGTEHVGVFAVVGAAALTSSVTHTVSVAIIVFELTGQIHYLIPMIVGVLLSFAVGNALSMSIYDVLLNMKGLPYLPTLKSPELYEKQASHVMETELATIFDNAKISDLESLVSAKGVKVPIID